MRQAPLKRLDPAEMSLSSQPALDPCSHAEHTLTFGSIAQQDQ